MAYILSTLTTAAVFVVLILLIAAKPKLSKLFTCAAFGLGGICGLFIYGYGYAVVTDNFLLAILKAVLAVCGSFVGKNEYSSIAAAPFMQTQWMQIICTFVQICSVYATTSAVIASLGAPALRQLRLWLGRRENLNLIYGINDNTLNFGKELVAGKQGAVVFVVPEATDSIISTVSALGCVSQNDASAAAGDKKFLRRLGIGRGKRKLTLYALSDDSNLNIQYAMSILEASKELNISAERTRLVLRGQEEVAVSRLQNTPEKYGYGFVTTVNEPQMAARLLTMKYPPCNAVSFDKNAKATENFEALLIGFGQVGQAVLKALVMNGQFEGSHFKLDVFGKDIAQIDGNFSFQFGQVFDQYDIQFHNHDARSRNMYDYLKQHAEKLRYVVISTGSEKDNHEIAEEIISYLSNIGHMIPVYKCTRKGVAAYNLDGTIQTSQGIYTADLLCGRTLDQKAMILNHTYQAQSHKTPLQNWMECDYFSRQSCRAATDFIPALLRAAGKTPEQVAAGDWALTKEQLENLSRTEHLRWCAFHYCMGFSPMTPEEYSERADIYCRQKAQEGKATIRIGKNMHNKTHACLICWEDLNALSAKESAITGKEIDYQAMDTDNVLAVPQLLQAATE